MVFASQTFHLNNWFGAVMGKYMFGDDIYAFYKVFRYVWIMDYCRFWSSGMPCSILRVFGDSIQFHWGFGEFFIIPYCVSMWALFLYCVGPIHWETNLREAIASFRKVKGSLLGDVLWIAYAGGSARLLPAKLKNVSKVRLCKSAYARIIIHGYAKPRN